MTSSVGRAALAKSIKANCHLAVVEADDPEAHTEGGDKEKGDGVNEVERVAAFMYISKNAAGEDERLAAPWATPGLMATCDYLISKWPCSCERACGQTNCVSAAECFKLCELC